MILYVFRQKCPANEEEQPDQSLHFFSIPSASCGAVFPFLAHLSRRLIGELIVYPWSVRRLSTMLKHLLLRNRLANQSQILCEPPWVGGTKFCSRHLGHMTKMAATPIYGKNPSKIFISRTGWRISTKLGM